MIINEIFYHAPDDLEDLQWIELYNDGDGAVDLTGWMLDGGSIFVFDATKIATQDYVVVASIQHGRTQASGRTASAQGSSAFVYVTRRRGRTPCLTISTLPRDKNGKWEMYPWDQDKTWGYSTDCPMTRSSTTCR